MMQKTLLLSKILLKKLFIFFCIWFVLGLITLGLFTLLSNTSDSNEEQTYQKLSSALNKDVVKTFAWPKLFSSPIQSTMDQNIPTKEHEMKSPMGGLLVLTNRQDNFLSTFGQQKNDTLWIIRYPLLPEKNESFEISSHFGYRLDPITQLPAMHQGVDFQAPMGTPIIATADGVVHSSGVSPGYGLQIEIRHANGFTTKYAHTSLSQVKAGDFVGQGQIIAYVGNSGRSTGTHLHYEVWQGNVPMNPIQLQEFK